MGATAVEHGERVRLVLEAILAHREGPLRHADLAAAAGFSPYHFARIFGGMVGEPLMELARRVRLERAAYRLRRSDSSVTEVAYEAGFETLEAFGRAFRAAYGASPVAYRRAGGHPSLLSSPSGVHWHPDGPIHGAMPPTWRTMIQSKIIQRAPLRVAAYRHVGESPGIDRSWAKLQPLLRERGLDAPGTRYFTRFYDDPETIPPDQTRSDLMFTVGPDFVPFEGVQVDELPGGEYAVFVHQGLDDLIVDTWRRAFSEWLPTSGREYDDVAFEEYVNGFYLRPERPDEPLIVTAVYVKLRGAGVPPAR
jgi:AraC family transcriptional regulator